MDLLCGIIIKKVYLLRNMMHIQVLSCSKYNILMHIQVHLCSKYNIYIYIYVYICEYLKDTTIDENPIVGMHVTFCLFKLT